MTYPRVGIGVLIFNENEELLLGKRLSHAHGSFTWAPPGGHLEFGESFQACAVREVFEETGLQLKPENFEFRGITNDLFKEEQKHYISIFMKTTIRQPEIFNKEPHKTEEWKWFKMDNLPSPIFLPLHNLLEELAQKVEKR